MITVFIPSGFTNERLYIIKVYFSDFLGLDYQIQYHHNENYIINISGKFDIEISDAFWINFKQDENYIKKEALPTICKFVETNRFIPEPDLPVLYGSPDFKLSQNKIICGNDIFASAFLLLTRWEEKLDVEKDAHGRFPDTENILVKFGISHRPIVNEYTEFLWNMLQFAGCKQIRKIQKYQLKLTHDIDLFAAYPNFGRFLKHLGGSLLKRRDVKEFAEAVRNYSQMIFKGKNDPYDNFDLMIQYADNQNITALFNFIPSKIGEADADYDITNSNVISAIKKIQLHGHKIGLHGSYLSYNNAGIFNRDLERLRQIVPEVSEGRQHYLRFENPTTWQLWEQAGLRIDSTLGFSTQAGFRCGVCYSFPVFDIEHKTELKLREEPLIFMDTALINQNLSEPEIVEKFKELKFVCQKYNGKFVVLFHNNIINFKLYDYL